MKFAQLRNHVERVERLTELRSDQTLDHWSRLQTVWRKAWSPGRIVIAGLAGGFVAGKLELPGKGDAVRWLKMISTVSGLFTAMQAREAHEDAERAADNTEDDARDTQTDASSVRSNTQPAREAAPDAPTPRPAEAATEMSEH